MKNHRWTNWVSPPGAGPDARRNARFCQVGRPAKIGTGRSAIVVVMAGPISRTLKEHKIEKSSGTVKGTGGKNSLHWLENVCLGECHSGQSPSLYPKPSVTCTSQYILCPTHSPQAHPHHRTEFGTQTTLQKDWQGHRGGKDGMGPGKTVIDKWKGIENTLLALRPFCGLTLLLVS